jgi:hypothetical protein
MLFDLRSPGRRRLIKTVYLFLALLIGVGLVGFGVGTGGSFGGLFSAAANGGGANGVGDAKIVKQLAKAEKQAKAEPNSAAAWLKAGKAAYNLAVIPTNFSSTVGYTTGGHAALDKMKAAWLHYLSLAPANPNVLFAQEVVAAFSFPPPTGTGIGDYPTAESAQEIVAEQKPSATSYEFLSYYAYQAKKITAGDQAAAKAVALAPNKKQATTLRQTLLAVRAQVTGATGASGASGATGAT